MARPIKRFPHNKCAECGADMREVIYLRPFAKICSDCKGIAWSGNAEVKQEHVKLKQRNSKMTPEELGMDEMFVDDPKAVKEIEYGKVSKRPTTINNNVNMLERNHHV
tara:strand:+ start:186 stop:509 length:324 start_codon:yes stop_codon:yes gene_type:complete